MNSYRTRLQRLEAQRHGTGVAAVEYHAGVWTHNGAVISEDDVQRLGDTHAHLIIRGEGVPHHPSMITIQRSYGQT